MGRDLCDAKAAGSVAICEAEVVGSLLLCKSVHVEILRAGLCVLSKSSHSAGNSKVCEVHSKPTIQKALLDFSSRCYYIVSPLGLTESSRGGTRSELWSLEEASCSDTELLVPGRISLCSLVLAPRHCARSRASASTAASAASASVGMDHPHSIFRPRPLPLRRATRKRSPQPRRRRRQRFCRGGA